jgi:hypothetical protein
LFLFVSLLLYETALCSHAQDRLLVWFHFLQFICISTLLFLFWVCSLMLLGNPTIFRCNIIIMSLTEKKRKNKKEYTNVKIVMATNMYWLFGLDVRNYIRRWREGKGRRCLRGQTPSNIYNHAKFEFNSCNLSGFLLVAIDGQIN